MSKIREIFCMLPVAVARSFPDDKETLCSSCFVDDDIFSHNGPDTDTRLESAT